MKYLNIFSKDYPSSNILNDVQLWAGAYVIDVKKPKNLEEIREKSQYCTVVNGNLNNLYSDQDNILKVAFPVVFKGMKCVGLYRIFEDIEESDDCKLAVNYDVE